MKDATNPWIAYRTNKKSARIRLFCLPYAGGAASIYSRWQSAFPEQVDVCSIEYPGRLNRLREEPFREIGPLVQALNLALEPCLDIPFAIFGYSMGALIAYEWTRELVRHRGIEPAHLLVAAGAAPHVRSSHLHETVMMSDSEFVTHIVSIYGSRIRRVLSDPEMGAIMLRMMRADLGMLDGYVYRDGPSLQTPITAFGGEQDSAIPHQTLREWRKYSVGPFALRTFRSDHFFIHTCEQALIDAVKIAIGSHAYASVGRTTIQDL